MGGKQCADLSILLGKRLDQLCIGLYQTQLRLSDDVCISIESDFEHTVAGQRIGPAGRSSTEVVSLVSLLGSTIERVASDARTALVLEFSNGDLLSVNRRSDGYETLSMTAPGVTIVVPSSS